MSGHHERAQDALSRDAVQHGEAQAAWRERQRRGLRALVEAADRASGYEARRAAFDAIGRDLLRIAREDPGLFAELWGIADPDATTTAAGPSGGSLPYSTGEG